MNRRQELNRQAQRTHRERKEAYIKSVEAEVLHVKDLYAKTIQERNQALAEVSRLKDILSAHGIPYELQTPSTSYDSSMPSYNGSSGDSVSGGFRQDSQSSGMSPPQPHTPNSAYPQIAAQLPRGSPDYNQLGTDFVLAYDSHRRPTYGRAAYPSPPPGQ